jgi:ankyrin repeat protein
MTHLLLDHGVSVNIRFGNDETPLVRATKCGNEALVRRLLEVGADPDTKIRKGSAVIHSGCAAIHEAVIKGHQRVVKVLIKQGGADINSRTDEGNTPLIIAVMSHKDSIVKLLLEYGANSLMVNKRGKNAFQYARESHNDVVTAELSMPNRRRRDTRMEPKRDEELRGLDSKKSWFSKAFRQGEERR